MIKGSLLLSDPIVEHFQAKKWELGGQGVKIFSRKCHIWNRRPWFAYSLCNCYGATMKIKGSLLLSAPIDKHFQAKKTKSSFGQNLTVFGDK